MDEHPRQRRPRNRIDLSGQTFGHLTALERVPKEVGVQGEKWLCRCSCERKTIVRVKDLRHHNTRSCGHLTGRPRVAPDQPHRAAELYPEIEVAVHAALKAGSLVPHGELRGRYKGRLSHGTYYRYVHRAELSYQAAGPQKAEGP
jgi:hypothetical protein